MQPRDPAPAPLSLEALSGLLARVDEGIFVLSPDWRFVYVNKAGAAIMGRHPEEMLGLHAWTEFPEVVGSPFHEAYLRAMETQEASAIEDYFAPWDRWFENRLYPSRDGLLVLFSDITTRRQGELAQLEALARLNLVLEGTQTGLWDWDLRTNKVRYSREWKSQIGYGPDEVGDDFEEWRSRVHPDDLAGALARVQSYIALPTSDWENEFRFRHRDGRYLWILTRAHIVRDDSGVAVRMVGTHIDITQGKSQKLLLEGQNRVLALAAGGASLTRVLDELTRVVEGVIDDSLVSILLLDNDGVHMRHGSSPSLSPAFVRAIDGLPIGPQVGSCGTAMYRRSPVVVEDIATDPLWNDYRAIAEASGLRACWSVPILDVGGHVLGSFATYFRAPRQPRPAELRVVEAATSAAAVVISSAQKTESLRSSELQLRRVISEAPLAIAMFDRDMRYIVYSDRWLLDYGLGDRSLVGKSHYDVFPEIGDAWKAIHQRAIAGEPASADSDRFDRADGSTLWLRWDVRPWHDAQGSIGGIIISSEDVSARLEAERRQREAHERMRSLAAHVEQAREAERARIARELHDELGQALTGVKIDLAWLRSRLRTGKHRDHVDNLGRLIDDTVAVGRRIASELRPGVLDDLGLAAAIRWQGKEFTRRTGIPVTISVADELPVDPERATAAFRVVQEALTNVARHAGASAAELRARCEEGALHVEVLDNGRGIATSEATGAASLGLLGMRERVATWEGTLEIATRPEGGTRLAARLPLADKREESRQ